MTITASDLEWTTDAACQYTDPELFHPDGHNALSVANKAKTICATCPMHAVIACARLALDESTRYATSGVWAGQYLGTAEASRASAFRSLRVIAGVPPKASKAVNAWPRPCKSCTRSMRPRNETVANQPGTVKYGANELCDTCAVAKRKGDDVGTFIKAAAS